MEWEGPQARGSMGLLQSLVRSPGKEVGWMDRLLKAGCYRAGGEDKENVMEDRKESGNHLRESTAVPGGELL